MNNIIIDLEMKLLLQDHKHSALVAVKLETVGMMSVSHPERFFEGGTVLHPGTQV